MLISVVIPHLDDLERLARCVAALEEQTMARDCFEIIVADNGSRCGAEAIRTRLPSVRVIPVAERGAGPARNGGAGAARADILAFTDSDCSPDHNWLAAGVEALQTCDIAGGAVSVVTAWPDRMTAVEAFETVFAFDNRTNVERRGFSVTANLMTTRAVFAGTGGFVNGVSEDLQWCRAARARGYRLSYAAAARVSHPARQTFDELAHKWRRITQETYGLWRADGRSRAAWMLRASAVLASPVWHAWRVLGSARLPSFRVRAQAIGVLFRIRTERFFWMIDVMRDEKLASAGHTAFLTQPRKAVP